MRKSVQTYSIPVPEDIYDLETRLQGDWLLETTGQNGQALVYLRFQVTGMKARLIGPFPTKKEALWALDALVGKVRRTVEGAYCEEIEDLLIQAPFHREDVVVKENSSTLTNEAEALDKHIVPLKKVSKKRKAA